MSTGGIRIAAVTGATGVVGPSVVRQLLGAGSRVRVLTRQPVVDAFGAGGVETVRGSVTDADAVRALVRGTDVVFHLAAKLHVYRTSPAVLAAYHEVNANGTAAVVDAAHREGCRRVVLFSTIAVYGCSRPGQVLDEEAPTAAGTEYARTKLLAEQIALSRQNRAGEPLAVVLRSAAVYGPRMKGNLRFLVQAISRGLFVPVGSGTNRRTLVRDEDLARAAILAGSDPGGAGRVFNVTDGAVHTVAEIIQTVCELLGRRPPRTHIPLGVAHAASRCVDTLLVFARQHPRAQPIIEKLTEDLAVRGERIQQQLGYHPAYDLRTGFREVLGRITYGPERAG